MKYIILFSIRIYQRATVFFYPRCRFYPSCSHYMHDAVGRYGSLKGVFLGIKRVLRCHPFNTGGYDPVP